MTRLTTPKHGGPPLKEDFSSPEDMFHLYAVLSTDITQLQEELEPLRDKYSKLQNVILSNQKFPNGMKRSRYPNIPFQFENEFNHAVYYFQKETADLQAEISQLTFLFSKEEMESLEKEVTTAKKTLGQLDGQIKTIDQQITALKAKTDTYRMSDKFQSVQRMKEETTKQYKELIIEAKKYSKNKERSPVGKSGRLDHLAKKLNDAKKRHTESCQKLISLRNQQMKEIEEATAKIKAKTEQSNAFFAVPPLVTAQ